MTRLVERVSRLCAPGEVAAEASAEHGNVFRKEGEFWTIAYAGTIFRLKDANGLHYIAHLLRHAGQEFHARDLALVDRKGEQGPTDLGSAGAVLDAEARSQYQRRLADLRDELGEAERFNDAGRTERAREEIEFLTHELAAAVGLGGRDREAASSTERARLMVTKSVKAVLRKIRERHPALGHHFASSIKTGHFCTYSPPPERLVAWMV